MDQATRIQITNAVRQERIEQLARQYMYEGGMGPEYFGPHSPAWGPPQTKIRDAALSRARDDVAVEMGLPVWEPAGDTDQVDWSAEPEAGLRAALQERDHAEQARDGASLIARRAAQMVESLEAQLKEFAGLDAQIDNFMLEQARAGTDEDLPYTLASAAKDRSKVSDRLDHAIKANQTLQGELRDAQRNLEKCIKVCGLWAQRIIIMEAEKVAAELFEVQQHADSLKDDLNALSHTTFAGSGGPVELTPTLIRALHLQSKPREENFRLIEPLKRTLATSLRTPIG